MGNIEGTTTPNIAGKLLEAAVRYSLGRQTYMPSFVYEFAADNIEAFPREALQNTYDYIDTAKDFGADFDKEMWMAFKYLLRDHLNDKTRLEPQGTVVLEHRDGTLWWLFFCAALRYDAYAKNMIMTPEEYENFLRENEKILPESWKENILRDLEDPLFCDKTKQFANVIEFLKS